MLEHYPRPLGPGQHLSRFAILGLFTPSAGVFRSSLRSSGPCFWWVFKVSRFRGLTAESFTAPAGGQSHGTKNPPTGPFDPATSTRPPSFQPGLWPMTRASAVSSLLERWRQGPKALPLAGRRSGGQGPKNQKTEISSPIKPQKTAARRKNLLCPKGPPRICNRSLFRLLSARFCLVFTLGPRLQRPLEKL